MANRRNFKVVLENEGYEEASFRYEVLFERNPREKEEFPGSYLPDGRPTPKYLADCFNDCFWEFGIESLAEQYPSLGRNHTVEWIGEYYTKGLFRLMKEKYSEEEAKEYI